MKLVLSLCGGGMRGVFTMRFLMHLDDELRKRSGKGIYNYVDLYAGSSIGSFVVGSFAYERLTADELDNLFNRKNANLIMNKTLWDCILGKFQNRPMYTGTGKRNFIDAHFQDVMLNDCQKKCLFTVYDASNRDPKTFKNWESCDETLRDVLDMSSAAPGYFPAVKSSRTGMIGIDGAIFANNPAHIAYANALKLFGEDEDIRVVSIGTGTQNNPPKLGDETLSWGNIQWVTKGGLVDRIMDGPEEEVHNLMTTLTCSLGHKYYRVNPKIDNMELNNTSEEYIEKTKDLADLHWKLHGESIINFILS